jgi:hypothetical protein
MGVRWIAKAVTQKAISLLPHPQRVNFLFQDKVTRGTRLTPTYVGQQFDWVAMHVDALRRHGGHLEGARVVELGSGWFPFVPLALSMGGADRVTMVDLEDLGRPELLLRTVDEVIAAEADGRLRRAVGEIHADRLELLRASRRRLAAGADRLGVMATMGLEVRAGDARQLVLDEPPDLICSNTVLEHIEPQVLEAILARFRDLARPGTVMSHLVDLCDHYAYVDPSVSVYQFLRFSDRAWRWIDNSVQPMNRLRASEYRAIYERLGIPVTEEHLTANDARELAGARLSPRFATMDPADVACTSTWLVTRFGDVR